MADVIQLLELGLSMVAAILCGAAIGLERQWRLRTAGIRTNALVSVGAALFVIVGAEGWAGAGADPTRVAAQVVSGIGFLGAGVILRDGLNIRGLTTAATLWCAAAVGSLTGAGMYAVALLATIAIVASNTLLRPVSRLINRRTNFETTPRGSRSDYSLEFVTTDSGELRVRGIVFDVLSTSKLSLRGIHTVAMTESRRKIVATVSADPSVEPLLLEQAMRTIGFDTEVFSSRWWPVEADE